MPTRINLITPSSINFARAGMKVQAFSQRSFYSFYLKNSAFFSRVSSLADDLESTITKRGFPVKFDRERFFAVAGVSVFAHRDQIRKVSGDPYFVHPLELAEMAVKEFHVADTEEIEAILLHDVIEDSEDFSKEAIEQMFGQTLANLVDGVTKITQMEDDHLINEENIDKFLRAVAIDVRVLHIKIMDRIVNLKDIEKMGRESKERNCFEALDFYVPLGIMCGFMKLARRLSSVAFEKVSPERYRQAELASLGIYVEKSEILRDLSTRARQLFTQRIWGSCPEETRNLPSTRANISARRIEVLTKPRTYYELEQISAMRGLDIYSISDVVMLQIITTSESDCYAAVEVVHSLGIPLDKFWRDYIKDPKINGYQSLHTAILIGDTVIRVQIRTKKMQARAQYGVLDDSAYSSGKFKQPRIPWLKNRWVKAILRTKDRRTKIILTKSFSQAKKTSIRVSGETQCSSYADFLLPKGLSPLDAAFIFDPRIGVRLKETMVQGKKASLLKKMEDSFGILTFGVSPEIIRRDYLAILTHPLAIFNFIDWLTSLSVENRMAFSRGIFVERLKRLGISPDTLDKREIGDVLTLIARVSQGEISARDASAIFLKFFKRKQADNA